MKIITIVLAAVVGLVLQPQSEAGNCHCRCVRTKCGVPHYAYGRRSPESSAIVVSETAIPLQFKLVSGAAIDGGNSVVATEKRFIADDAAAGPIGFSQIAAVLEKDGHVRLTGVLTHSGGDTGQFLGGKAVVRVQVLSTLSPAPSVAAAAVVWTDKAEYWVPRGQFVDVDIKGQAIVNVGDFPDLTNIQVYLEQYPNR